ncbi:MAG: CDP-alcohol phosphatidyltransferase family protein [Nanoarchaeota archaeon]|nr:CDP-alcohol phosphatidyltransferase family protein [Nanoarchaeota archaeon]
MRSQLKKIPDLITKTRILLSIIMVLLAFYDQSLLFFSVYLFASFTDVLDGLAARRLKAQSKKGARLDTNADEILYFCLIFGLVLLIPRIMIQNMDLLISILIINMISRMLVFLRRKSLKKILMSLYLSKLNAFILPFGIFMILISDNYSLIRPFIMILTLTTTLCRIEEVSIHYKYKEVPENIKSIFQKF